MTEQAKDEILNEWAGAEEQPSPPPAWRKRRDVFLLLSGGLAAGCYFFCHFPYLFLENGHLPGIGFTLSQWALLGMGLLIAGRERKLRLKKNPGGVFLLLFALLLGLCFSLFANDALRAMNLPVVWLSSAAALLSLAGVNPLPPLSARGLAQGCKAVIPSFFIHWLTPFRLRAEKTRQDENVRQRREHLVLGIALGFPIVCAALLLLSSADSVFSAFITDGFSRLDALDGAFFLRLALSCVGGLCLFSFLRYASSGETSPVPEKKERAASAVTLATVLVMLDAVYAVFAYIQFRYLFFSAPSSVPGFQYAEYARSGFFQLVLLAFLTLLLVLPFLSLGRESRAVRCLCAFTALLTIVIDVSAFMRMRLYIEAFGLSILRLVTLWGMAMILLSLLACLLKCLWPAVPICPALAAVALCSWLGLNLANPDRLVARYQVDAYNQGILKALDTDYLIGLSPDVMPELARIGDLSLWKKALSDADAAFSRRYPCPYDWSLSWQDYRGGGEASLSADSILLAIDLRTDTPVYSVMVDYLFNGEPRGTAGCCVADRRSPLSGRVTFDVGPMDIPEGADLSRFGVQVWVKTTPGIEESLAHPGAHTEECQAGEALSLPAAFGEAYLLAVEGNEENGFTRTLVEKD